MKGFLAEGPRGQPRQPLVRRFSGTRTSQNGSHHITYLGMITHVELLTILVYDPTTGFFYSKSTGNRLYGSENKSGYCRLTIKRRKYRAARVAFFYMTGRWPVPTVDHKNRVRNDDRWENLQEATYHEQSVNRVCIQGFKRTHGDGVYFRPDRKKCWRARTWVLTPSGRKRISIGQFFTEQEAVDAYHAYRQSLLPTSPAP